MSRAPLIRDRLRRLLAVRGRPRLPVVRRVAAVLLVLAAAVVAVRPPPQARGEPTVPVLVTTRDLPPGAALSRADVRVVDLPESLRPDGALTAAAEITARVLTGAAARGEPLTTARLVGRENTRLTTGDPAATAVPVRLADPEVAALLTPGARVDVVTVSPDNAAAGVLLAADATVVAVHEPPAPAADQPGRLVLLAVPRQEATRLASVSLGQPVAVTLR